MWDTCRGDRVEVNGYALPTAPRLAGIAAEGVTFRHCFTPSPWTPPAHASLFTGLLPSRHGLRENRGDRVHPGVPLLAATLAHVFNHATHHRGQITAALTALGHDGPVLDLVYFLRAEQALRKP